MEHACSTLKESPLGCEAILAGIDAVNISSRSWAGKARKKGERCKRTHKKLHQKSRKDTKKMGQEEKHPEGRGRDQIRKKKKKGERRVSKGGGKGRWSRTMKRVPFVHPAP